ncbi:MAG: lysine--tRNA ligase [Armatimonadetes bacterium]|nr:lysine--tRNA ligase [Armatimonadota bacterium]MDW8122854.1 lysine--tRNA ligase [Armatimonadota bacterium]
MESSQSPEEQLYKARLANLENWRQKGKDPFAITRYERTHLANEIEESFTELEGKVVRVAGRISALRAHGKVTFADLLDGSGKIQIMARVNVLTESGYELFGQLDVGDIIGAEGTVLKTRTGEITVDINDFTLLSKALRPIPEKFHGLKETEVRYRKRYLDLIANASVRHLFTMRSRIIQAIRRVLDQKGFLEVETPILQPVYGGALAKPFITYHNALQMSLYLRIAPELYLKRLVVGGLEKVYEIGRNFRNEGVDARHNPEFTMLEAYEAYADYHQMMSLVEELVTAAAEEVHQRLQIRYGDWVVDLTPPWTRKSLLQALQEATGVDFLSFRGDDEKAREVGKQLGLSVEPNDTWGRVLDEALKKKVAPQLIQPTFLIDYPVEISPLAKRKPIDPEMTERFQAFIGGLEVANAFTELNDPIDQRERLAAQQRQREKGDEEAHPYDWDFITALEYGMPPTGGLGIGIDRLTMILTNSPSIREVILFPQLRPEEGQGV